MPFGPGQIVRPGDVILRVADTSRLLLDVAVEFRISRQITLNQSARIQFDAVADRVFTGHVVSIQARMSRTGLLTEASIMVQLDDSTEDLLPGMTAKVRFDLAKAP